MHTHYRRPLDHYQSLLPEGPFCLPTTATLASTLKPNVVRELIAWSGLHWADPPQIRSILYRGRRLVRLSDVTLAARAMADSGMWSDFSAWKPEEAAPW
jgi:hypothetical protein